MSPYAPTPQPAPPRKSGRGCLVALGVVLGLGAVASLVGAIALYKFSQSPDGKRAVKLMSGTLELSQKAMKAPGTAAVRAAGCKTAMVVDARDFAELFEQTLGTDAQGTPDMNVVVCQVGVLETLPSCGAIAKAYVGEVGTPRGDFLVTVQRQGQSKPACNELFDTRGDSLGPTAR